VSGQRLPFEEGSKVRVLRPDIFQPLFRLGDHVDANEWLTGTVTGGTREGVSLVTENPPVVVVAWFNETTRLQVARGRQSRTSLGAVLGFAAGATAGATFLKSTLGRRQIDDTKARFFGGLLYGLAGGALGALVASRFGPPRWEEIRLARGRIPVAPLTAPEAELRPFGSTQRWNRFDATDRDFEEFFLGHASTLEPLEGLWEIEASGGTRLAVVRDSRFLDFDYVVVQLASYYKRTRLPHDGVIIAAIRETDREGEFQFRYTPSFFGSRRAASPFVHATLRERWLHIRLPGGSVVRWVKAVP
jgi:hypothetical protein